MAIFETIKSAWNSADKGKLIGRLVGGAAAIGAGLLLILKQPKQQELPEGSEDYEDVEYEEVDDDSEDGEESK